MYIYYLWGMYMPAATLNFTSTNTDSYGNLVPNHAEQGATFTCVFTLHQGSLTDPYGFCYIYTDASKS